MFVVFTFKLIEIAIRNYQMTVMLTCRMDFPLNMRIVFSFFQNIGNKAFNNYEYSF